MAIIINYTKKVMHCHFKGLLGCGHWPALFSFPIRLAVFLTRDRARVKLHLIYLKGAELAKETIKKVNNLCALASLRENKQFLL
jgi:hypothetical protein